MKNVIALVNLHNSTELGPLTANRPLATTTFLGRYTFIDFALSNLTHSGIDNIGILVKDHSRSIIKHIGPESTYLKNTKIGFQSLFINEKGLVNPQFNTDVNNIRENDWFLYDKSAEYIVIVPVQFVLRCDFDRLIEDHIKSGKQCSLVYRHTYHSETRFLNCDTINIDPIGNISEFDVNHGKFKEADISLETYIFNKNYFKRIIEDIHNVSSMFTLRDVIHYLVKNNQQIHAIKFEGYCRYFGDLLTYRNYSFELLDKKIHVDNLFTRNWNFYTTSHNTRPVFYGVNCDVKSSILANGCLIDGTVKHSVLSRNVVVEEGAIVENCIIFTDCRITSGTVVRNCIIDKHCVIKNKKIVEGTYEEPLYIPQGAKI